MKTRFYIDTCSLIALQYSGLFNEITENFELVITDIVITELRDMAQFNDNDGLCAKRILKDEQALNVIQSGSYGDAELELMDLAHGERSFFVSDDIKAMKNAPEGLIVLHSIHLIYLLFRKGIIDKEAAIDSYNNMRKARDWKSNSLSIIGKQLFLGN